MIKKQRGWEFIDTGDLSSGPTLNFNGSYTYYRLTIFGEISGLNSLGLLQINGQITNNYRYVYIDNSGNDTIGTTDGIIIGAGAAGDDASFNAILVLPNNTHSQKWAYNYGAENRNHDRYYLVQDTVFSWSTLTSVKIFNTGAGGNITGRYILEGLK